MDYILSELMCVYKCVNTQTHIWKHNIALICHLIADIFLGLIVFRIYFLLLQIISTSSFLNTLYVYLHKVSSLTPHLTWQCSFMKAVIRVHDLLLGVFPLLPFLIVYTFIQMCIHCLVHLSPPTPAPSSLPHHLFFQAEPVLPPSPILLNRKHKR
jgi:hypothetical protein